MSMHVAPAPVIPGAGVQTVAHGVLTLKSGPVRTIVFGDSITQSSSFVNGSGLWTQSSGYAETSLMKAGPRFRFVRNAGIAGNTTSQMLARIKTDVLAYKPDMVLFMGGTNDLLDPMSNANMALLMNNIESMVIQMLNAGIVPVIVTPPPKETNQSGTIAVRNAIRFYYMLAQYYGLPLVDIYKLCVNPATGGYQTGLSGDGVHPGNAGIQLISTAVGTTLASLPYVTYYPTYLAAVAETSGGNPANIIPNGSFANITTPPNPDGWNPNGTGATVTTAASTAPYAGNDFIYTMSSGGGRYALFSSQWNVGSGYNVGDTMIFSGRVKTTGLASNAGGLTLSLTTDNAGTVQPFSTYPQNADCAFSMEFIVPAGINNMDITLYVQDNATYTVSNLTLWSLTQAQAIWQPGLQ